MAQGAVLIELLENSIQIELALLHNCQLFLPNPHFPLNFGGLSATDACRTLSGQSGHTPQILQYHLVQDALPNIVGRADLGTLLFVGAAGKVVDCFRDMRY